MDLKSVIEALLFSAQKPLTAAELKGVLGAAAEHSDEAAVRALRRTKLEEVEAALEQLAREHAEAARSYRLACVAGAWQFVTVPDCGPWVRTLSGERARPGRLSQPALETLTIVAYRQPITRAEIEQIRGVSVDGVMQTLLERGLIEAVGRAEVVGRPMTYGTSKLFLEYFGLRSLEDLPAADELRRIPVERPPSLVTVDPGLATAPPEQLLFEAQPRAAVAPSAAVPGGSEAAETDAAAETPAAAPTTPPAAAAPEATSAPAPGPEPKPAALD